MKTLITLFALLIATSTAQARENSTLSSLIPLKEAAVAKFVKLANDPKSALAKRIKQINKETEDGRNAEGTIELPITKDSVQAMLVEGETIYVPWHYANKKGNKCYATGASAVVRIYLMGETAAHYASGLVTYEFDMEVTQNLRFTTPYDYCELDPETEEGSDYRSSFAVTAPTERK